MQLADVARGLNYMHGEGIIHGDLKGVSLQRLGPHRFL
jgi:serine/threonine protein kinase